MSKFTVLIVEDEFLIASQIERLVSKLGCEILGPVAQLTEAFAMIETGEADAALLDVSLRNGEKVYPAADELRRRSIPFAFVTAYGADGIDPSYRDATVISKPFSEEAVRSFIHEVREAVS